MREQDDTPRDSSQQALEIISRIEAIGGKFLMPSWGRFQVANWQNCPEQLFLVPRRNSGRAAVPRSG